MIGEGSSPIAVSRSRTRGTGPIVAPMVSSTEPGLAGRSRESPAWACGRSGAVDAQPHQAAWAEAVGELVAAVGTPGDWHGLGPFRVEIVRRPPFYKTNRPGCYRGLADFPEPMGRGEVYGLAALVRSALTSAQSECQSFRSASGSLARASASRMPARSVSTSSDRGSGR